MEFNSEQLRAYEALKEGKNVFLTGPGGTGKSYFIQYICSHLERDRPRIRIATTALTGCAAILLGVGAKTIHSWAGIGLGRGSIGEIVVQLRRNRKAIKNWLTTDLLIIDEISMMSAELLEKLNEVAKIIRKSSVPFGGLQLLFVGDFYQLPPIGDGGVEAQFAFESPVWSACIHDSIMLKTIMRQKDDVFRALLDRARTGDLLPEDIELLRSRLGLEWSSNEIKPTLLFSRRNMVDRINSANLKSLAGDSVAWKAKTLAVATDSDTALPKEDADRLITAFDRDAPYDENVELKIGAQVMLITNLDLDAGLVNGSRGVVVEIRAGPEPIPVVQFLNGLKLAVSRNSWPIDDYNGYVRSQIPLRLAWAGTIHKSQGSTLDCALIDIGRSTFEYGQAYVALSRVKSIDSLYIHEFAAEAIRAHPKVKAFYASII